MTRWAAGTPTRSTATSGDHPLRPRRLPKAQAKPRGSHPAPPSRPSGPACQSASVPPTRPQALGGGVRQQVPGNDQDGPADGDDGALGAAAAGDAPVAFAEDGAGLGGSGGGFTKNGGRVGVAVAGGALAVLVAGRFRDAGGQPGPGDQVPGGGERVMPVPISARMTCAAARLMPGISSSRAIRSASGAACAAIAASRLAMSALMASTRASMTHRRRQRAATAPDFSPGTGITPGISKA